MLTFTDHLFDAIGSIIGWAIVLGIPVSVAHWAGWLR